MSKDNDFMAALWLTLGRKSALCCSTDGVVLQIKMDNPDAPMADPELCLRTGDGD